MPHLSNADFAAARAKAVAADKRKDVEADRKRIALSQSERQWGPDPTRNIRPQLDEPAEQDLVATFLNGAFAEWVDRATLCRWVKIAPAELDAVDTPADYCRLLYLHLVGKA